MGSGPLKSFWRGFSGLALVAGICATWASPTAAQALPNMPRVRQTIQTLTAPRLHGRGYVQRGDQKAAAYLRRRFRQLGLQPLAPSYTQPFPLDVNTFPGRMALQLRPITGTAAVSSTWRPLRPGYDFIAAPASGSAHFQPAAAAQAQLLDTLIFTDAQAQQRWLRQPWGPNGAVLRARDVARLAALPAARQHLDSAAFVFTLVPKLTASLAATQARQAQIEILDSVWYTTVGPSRSIEVAVQLDARLQRGYTTQNLVGFVPGRVRPDSFLVVTAHYDHLGRMGRRVYFPGANDNASGTALLLELAAYYTRPENQPAYSVAFMAFGAEEAGLVGSRYFVEHPLVPLNTIRFLVNLDLLGTGNEGLTVVNGHERQAQFQLLQRLNERRQAVPNLAARGRAANSDHFPFSERGVPAFFLYTRGGSRAYHDVHDRAATLPLTAFAGVFQLARDFLDALGANSAQQ